MRIFKALVLGGVVLGALGAMRRPAASQAPHPAWARDSVIYELNVRQFTPEGTFRAILPHVAELKKLGVDIVWFMPIHPIGKQNRKGSLGSYYAVADYYGVNPEFGTMDDFRALVKAFHAAGMRVIIDMVANHTAWDNPLAARHPDWFKHDASGKFVPPVADWQDVIALDYKNPKLREYMWTMLEYWIRDVGLDGFRCDVANMVPTSFWEEARTRLQRIKPVFMLAEAESPQLLRRAFDCDYASELFHLFVKIAKGQARTDDIDVLLAADGRNYPRGSWRMLFTTNHDQNTWLESDVNLYGRDGARAFAVLSFALPGQPLVYSGQEVGNPKRLAFFERDPIDWDTPGAADMRDFYTRLIATWHAHADLRHGTFRRVPSRHPVYSFWRGSVLVVANLSGDAVTADVPRGKWRDLLTGATVAGGRQQLKPWTAYLLEGPG